MSTPLIQLTPYDEFNIALEKHVHPRDWVNPKPDRPYSLVVIGAGTAGLVSAAVAAGLGARVALIERELMGGDCLNVGCVPSKGIISSARVAATVRHAGEFGIESTGEVSFNFTAAMQRMRRLRAHISPADSAARFKEKGVDVFFGNARFIDNSTIEIDQHGNHQSIHFKKAVIATGARAAAPPIAGLDSVKYLTNESIFSLTELPSKLGVIGGGPIGAELAQSFARFGSHVTLIEMGDHILSREDHDAARIVQQQLIADGVEVVCNSRNLSVCAADHGIRLTGQQGSESYDIVVDQLLVAVGRAPNTDGLNLDGVGVEFDKQGVKINDFLQTTNKRIYAAGDICSPFKFTHAADFMARYVVQNALFSVGPFGRRKHMDLIIPWATYTSPEIAHVGMYEHEAAEKGMQIDTYIQKFEDVDRAILEGTTEGFVKVHVKQGTDRIVGATIVAENAGDMISEITLAIKNGIGLSKIGSTIHPYPTQAEAIRKLGDQYGRTRLTPLAARILKLLMRFNVGS